MEYFSFFVVVAFALGWLASFPSWLRSFVSALSGGVGLAGFFLAAVASVTAATPCNLLVIVADDMSWNQVSYQDSNYYQTPNIDRIAREGVAFSNAYSAAPICSPTRAAIMTGKAPARLHLTDFIPGGDFPEKPLVTPRMQQGLPLAEKTIAEYLREAGYRTGLFGKWHLAENYQYRPGRPMDPESQGFEVVFHTVKPDEKTMALRDAHNADEITDRAIAFVEAQKARPFFCYVSHNVVHRPLAEEPGLVAKYERKLSAKEPRTKAVMGAMIERMDTGIGRLLETLDRLDLTRRTLVIFASDNGAVLADQSQAPFRSGKATLWEGGIRVPLAIRWPGTVRAGATSAEPVVSQDLFYTMLSAVGPRSDLDRPDGVDLMPLLREGRGVERTYLYWHYPHYHHLGDMRPASAIRKGRYKLIEWHEGVLLGKGPEASLFDLDADPGESRDLMEKEPRLARELLTELRRWRMSVGAQEMSVRAGKVANK